ncbi:hypothetical protein EJ04DRAFT_593065 [Polyplosphaeria fusca]|uniref:Phosphatidylinositol N-acetylglucosaminyltransferase subunit H conserved domain-containing protein n=1 Tax=Polyplosphaeria fusca TaxID=682080 RepID=A0A9P4V6J3_9PLEO|nr:hypothetical protein EJ04DRAFT_593065 [Polyplosphaeria fusca]
MEAWATLAVVSPSFDAWRRTKSTFMNVHGNSESRYLTPHAMETFTVLQPTSSTVSFTVSTRPALRTIPTRLSYYVSIIIKILLGALALVALWTKWRTSSAKPTAIIGWMLGDALEVWLVNTVNRVQWMYLAPLAGAVIYSVSRRGYTEESLLVLSSLGLQTRTSAPSYLSTSTTRFIPSTSIQDIFIHEAFKGFEVRFYLAIVVKGEEDVVVVFPKLLPKREVLEEVWRGARACLYGGGDAPAKEKGKEKA